MNYTQLVQAIQDYTQNDEATFVTNIPVFVAAAEQRVVLDIQLPDFQFNDTSIAFVSGTSTFTLPTGFLAPLSFAVIDGTGAYTYLLNKNVSFIREVYPLPTTSGLPRHYALYDATTYLVGPTPDANYSTELNYIKQPESIVTAATTWLGDNAETMLLYGALIEANTFMKGEDDVAAQYEERYAEALVLFQNLGEALDRQDVYRSGDIRRPVQ